MTFKVHRFVSKRMFCMYFIWLVVFSVPTISMAVEDNLFLVLHKKLFGFVDLHGKVKIPFKFRNASDFNEGLAAVSYWGKYGYINAKGKFVIKPQYCFAREFSNGRAWVKSKWGEENLCIDKDGGVIFSIRCQKVEEFSEDMAAVLVNGKYGYINNKGQIVIQPKFDEALGFSNGLACVEMSGKWGFIDNSGKFVISPRFLKANNYFVGEKIFCYSETLDGTRVYVPSEYEIKEPVAFVTENNNDSPKLINKKGEEIKTKCGQKFSVMSSGNLALAFSGGKWGFIDRDGKFAIPPKFQDGDEFQNGLALVEFKNEYMYINEKGHRVANTGLMLND